MPRKKPTPGASPARQSSPGDAATAKRKPVRRLQPIRKKNLLVSVTPT